MGKILIVGGVRNWSMDRVCRGLIPHSKHDIEVTNYWIGGYTPSDWDGIYIHSGAVMSGKNKQYILDHREDTRWAVGVRGPTAFKRNVARINSKLWDAYSCGSAVWIDAVKRGSKELDIQGYVCHGGIDLSFFTVQPFPEKFTIGWVGNAGNGAKRFRRFYELPFRRLIVGGGGVKEFYDLPIQEEIDSGVKFGTEFVATVKYPLLNDLYAKCSVYVNVSFREGGPLPIKEAAACGRPVVCTNTGDAPEWIPKEYIVETESRSYDRDKMIEIINRFKNDRELLEREGKRFKELSKRWDFSVIVKEYDAMFDGMLSR